MSSLFGHDRTNNSIHKPFSSPSRIGHQQEIEEQIRLENEALIDSLSNGVLRMKAVAGGLGREVREQNVLLKSLSNAFYSAQNGVGMSINHLKNVVNRYGWKHTCYFSIIVLALLYILLKVIF